MLLIVLGRTSRIAKSALKMINYAKSAALDTTSILMETIAMSVVSQNPRTPQVLLLLMLHHASLLALAQLLSLFSFVGA